LFNEFYHPVMVGFVGGIREVDASDGKLFNELSKVTEAAVVNGELFKIGENVQR
jgi:hypothetical protein